MCAVAVVLFLAAMLSLTRYAAALAGIFVVLGLVVAVRALLRRRE